VVGALVLVWAADLTAISRRHHAVAVFGTQSEPLVVTAQRIQTELDQADASAANAFLAGGIEPADQRATYQGAIDAAARDLADAAREVGLGGAGVDSLHTIASQLPVYTGLVEQARAGNRQNFPAGAAYLRDASQLLRMQIIPAAAALATVNARRLNSSESSASALADLLVVIATALILLIPLFAIQRLLLRRTRRAVNIGLGAGSVVAALLVLAVLTNLAAERSAVVSANSHAYAGAATLARARALAFQAKADESQALIARGNGQSYRDDLTAATAAVGPLLGHAIDVDASSADQVSAADQTFASFLAFDQAIAACDAAGQHDQAVSLALGASTRACAPPALPGGTANGLFQSFDASLQGGLNADQADFVSKVGAARRDLQRLPILVTLAAILAGLFALAGAQQRINEYR
jgi:hypothetical protein